MTQTIEQLQAKVAELEADVERLSAAHVKACQANADSQAELAAAQEEIKTVTEQKNRMWFEMQTAQDQLAKAKQRIAEWQPISTAPKCSSTVILGFDPSWYDIATPMFWSEKKSNWRFYQIDEEIRPTHWMPLPKAPNGASS